MLSDVTLCHFMRLISSIFFLNGDLFQLLLLTHHAISMISSLSFSASSSWLRSFPAFVELIKFYRVLSRDPLGGSESFHSRRSFSIAGASSFALSTNDSLFLLWPRLPVCLCCRCFASVIHHSTTHAKSNTSNYGHNIYHVSPLLVLAVSVVNSCRVSVIKRPEHHSICDSVSLFA